MRIGLFGIGGVYNYGCEAIVRGATEYIKKIWEICSEEEKHHLEKMEVVYYSFNYEYDSKRLADLDIEIVPIRLKRTLKKIIFNKVMRLTWFEGCELFYDYESIISDADMFFFIGGDILTIPAVQREKDKYRYVNSMVEFGKKAIRKNKPVILYGASVGPFGHYNKAVKYYKTALKEYRVILCREYSTIEYLKTLGLNNMFFSPDPAFLVELPESCRGLKNEVTDIINSDNTRKPIGINLSPLSLSELYQDGNYTQLDDMVELLRRIQREFDRNILLLPHVISSDSRDNDADFMEQILEKLNDDEKQHYMMADYSDGFLGIKQQLMSCEVIVSARMHCAINAIHENIPTLFLSYSQKSVGMCEYVYGTDRWVVDIRKADEKLIEKIKTLIEADNKLQKVLQVRNRQINNEFLDSLMIVKEKMVEIQGRKLV